MAQIVQFVDCVWNWIIIIRKKFQTKQLYNFCNLFIIFFALLEISSESSLFSTSCPLCLTSSFHFTSLSPQYLLSPFSKMLHCKQSKFSHQNICSEITFQFFQVQKNIYRRCCSQLAEINTKKTPGKTNNDKYFHDQVTLLIYSYV